jgi:hypothetical protein
MFIGSFSMGAKGNRTHNDKTYNNW